MYGDSYKIAPQLVQRELTYVNKLDKIVQQITSTLKRYAEIEDEPEMPNP